MWGMILLQRGALHWFGLPAVKGAQQATRGSRLENHRGRLGPNYSPRPAEGSRAFSCGRL